MIENVNSAIPKIDDIRGIRYKTPGGLLIVIFASSGMTSITKKFGRWELEARVNPTKFAHSSLSRFSIHLMTIICIHRSREVYQLYAI